MADFPPAALVGKEDGKYRQNGVLDPALKKEVEGGYTVSRPKYTRTPRQTFKTGFTDITDAERQALVTFWNSKRGTSMTFTWEDPVTAVIYTVRFAGPMTFRRSSIGPRHHWDVPDVTLVEA